jgi:hypothetical protein
MSTTFSQNIATINTLVFDGTETLSTENLPGPGNTRQFDMVTRFTTPFLYDPAAGNLLLEYQYTSDKRRVTPMGCGDRIPTSRLLLGIGSATAPTGSFITS